MDIFNSALKNPIPPPRKDSSETPAPPGSYYSTSSSETTPVSANISTNGSMSINSAGETLAPDLSVQKKKKNSRRKHRNSHLGCGTCKKRRIKCDENLPLCLNCLKGKLHCAYLNLDAPARNALRMAQYNQNLRQDKLLQDGDENGPSMDLLTSLPQSNAPSAAPPPLVAGMGDQNPAVVQAQVHAQVHAHQQFFGASGQQAFAVPYPVIQTASNMIQPQQAHVIQLPYGPLVSIQPIANVNGSVAAIPAYSQVPVHQVPLQQMVYPQPGMLNGAPTVPPSAPSSVPQVFPMGLLSLLPLQMSLVKATPVTNSVSPVTQTPAPLSGPGFAAAPLTTTSSMESSGLGQEELLLPPLNTVGAAAAAAANVSPAGALLVPAISTSLASTNPLSLKTSPKIAVSKAQSYTLLPSIVKDVPHEGARSSGNLPVLPSILAPQRSSIKSESPDASNSDDTKLPPIKLLKMDEGADSSDKIPKILKLLS